MDGRSKGTLILRVGTFLVSIAVALVLVSQMASATVAGYRCPWCSSYYYQGNSIPPNSYLIVWPTYAPYYLSGAILAANQSSIQQVQIGPVQQTSTVSSREMFYLEASTPTTGVKAGLMVMNLTDYYLWANRTTGAGIYNVTASMPHPLVWMDLYIAQGHVTNLSSYRVGPTPLIVRHLSEDYTPLVVVIENRNLVKAANLSLFTTTVGLPINPDVGYRASALVGAPGVLLMVIGISERRRQGRLTSPAKAA